LECWDGLAGDFPREQGNADVMRSAFELTGRMDEAKSTIVCCIASWISLRETWIVGERILTNKRFCFEMFEP